MVTELKDMSDDELRMNYFRIEDMIYFSGHAEELEESRSEIENELKRRGIYDN